MGRDNAPEKANSGFIWTPKGGEAGVKEGWKREYDRKRRAENIDGVFGVYKLSEAEKLRLGLKKPAPVIGDIRVAIPKHYGANGVQWVSEYVTEAQLETLKVRYPKLQVIERKKLTK